MHRVADRLRRQRVLGPAGRPRVEAAGASRGMGAARGATESRNAACTALSVPATLAGVPYTDAWTTVLVGSSASVRRRPATAAADE